MKYCGMLIIAQLFLFFSGCSQNNPGYVIGDDYYCLNFRISDDEKGFIADIKKEFAAIQNDKKQVYLQDRLLEAIDKDFRAGVLTLIKLGVDINYDLTEGKGFSEKTLDIKGLSYDYGSPIEYAALQGKVLFLDLYLNAKIGTHINNLDVSKSFICAIEAENLEFAYSLIRSDFGPKGFIWDDIDYIRIRDKRIFKLLLDNGLNPNLFGYRSGKGGYGGYYGVPPIFFRVREPEIAEMMIDYGADVNMTGRYGQTFLHTLALVDGGSDLVRTLLGRGAKVNLADENGDTPLLLLYKAECFDILISRYTVENYYRIPRYESTDLYKYRTQRKKVGASVHLKAQCLIDGGADVNYKNEKGLTALHYAAALQDICEIHFLIKNGAYINARDNNGNTPLHIAAMHNLDESYIKHLIDCGADVNIKNKNGNTPLDILEKWKNKAK